MARSNTAAIAVRKKKTHPNSVSLPVEVIFHVIMIIVAAMCIIPFIFVVIISFSSEESIRAIGYSFHPIAWSTEAYKYIAKLGDQL